jgi:magnesium-transporting ATPase (P-type)
MAMVNMQQRAHRVTRFVTVQLIALVGWIIVQSFFSLSSLSRTIPFAVTLVIEAIWWIATLVIMFLLFRREYSRFVQAVLELEEADRRLRERTNNVLFELKNQGDQEEKISRPD